MKRSVTGMQPSGTPHLGNYLGMIRPALRLAEETEAFAFVADYHALTTVRDPEALRRMSVEIAATLLALGLDPGRGVLYRQSDVPEVCELSWLLACVTPKGLLNRGHAYKAANDENRSHGRDVDAGISAGLFDYPLLMAADILCHHADLVPVGFDQRQHVEMARDIAHAFNAVYGAADGPVLTVPEPSVDERVMLIPGLDGRKMSKSYDNVIPIFAPTAVVRKRVMSIVTDSRPRAEPKDPDSCRVFNLLRHLIDGNEATLIATRYRDGGVAYGEVKERLAGALESRFGEARERFDELVADGREVRDVLAAGSARARESARATLDEVRAAVGIAPPPDRFHAFSSR